MLTKKPPVWSVCLTRPQLYAVRAALRRHNADLHNWVVEKSPVTGGEWQEDREATDAYRSSVHDALQKVHAILLDAGGVDDTL